MRKPMDKILELMPLVLAQSLVMLLETFLTDKLADIYGLFGQEKNCHLFIFQYVINMFSGSKGVELTLQAVEKLIDEKMLLGDKNHPQQCDQLWQQFLYNQYHKMENLKLKFKLRQVEVNHRSRGSASPQVKQLGAIIEDQTGNFTSRIGSHGSA